MHTNKNTHYSTDIILIWNKANKIQRWKGTKRRSRSRPPTTGSRPSPSPPSSRFPSSSSTPINLFSRSPASSTFRGSVANSFSFTQPARSSPWWKTPTTTTSISSTTLSPSSGGSLPLATRRLSSATSLSSPRTSPRLSSCSSRTPSSDKGWRSFSLWPELSKKKIQKVCPPRFLRIFLQWPLAHSEVLLWTAVTLNLIFPLPNRAPIQKSKSTNSQKNTMDRNNINRKARKMLRKMRGRR